MAIALGVPGAGEFEELKIAVAEVVDAPAQLSGKFSPAGAVAGVVTIVEAPAVMKEREQADDRRVCAGPRGEQQSIALDAAPVLGPVNRGMPRGEWRGDELPERLEVSVHSEIRTRAVAKAMDVTDTNSNRNVSAKYLPATKIAGKFP